MTRFPEAMFYNLHTHISNTNENVIFIHDNGLNNPVKTDKNIFYSAGIHPWYIREKEVCIDLEKLRKIAELKNVIALGECGLDKKSKVDFNLQQEVFREEIKISEELKKPLIIHCVKAVEELIRLKKEMRPMQRWIIHGFRGKPQQMHQLIAFDFYLSFGFRYNRETVRHVPADRMFLETDDNPGSIIEVYEKIALERSISPEGLIEIISFNFTSLFGIV